MTAGQEGIHKSMPVRILMIVWECLDVAIHSQCGLSATKTSEEKPTEGRWPMQNQHQLQTNCLSRAS